MVVQPMGSPYSQVSASAPLFPKTASNGNNPFKKPAEAQQRNTYDAGSPWWWLQRLTQKLMDRQERFNKLENYATGDHPLPNNDLRYAKAMKELQRIARTNYCDLVIEAVVERMSVKGFRFGPADTADEDAKRIWDFSDMDYQSTIGLKTAATFGLCYALVSPPDTSGEYGDEAEPIITIEDPRMCIVEHDPKMITRSVAGLKVWQDDVVEAIVAVLYLPNEIYTFAFRNTNTTIRNQEPTLLFNSQNGGVPNAGHFELVLTQENSLGEVPLVEGNWQPSFGEVGFAEHEGVIDIQDRINLTVLHRLEISRTQAFRQRWATGLSVSAGKNTKGGGKPPFDPGADQLWVTANDKAKFGDFDTADIEKILLAVRDDVGDLAAKTRTPGTYLMNRMVNVSGDTLTQDQSALVAKIRVRENTMGWFYEKLMKVCFKYKKDDRWKLTEATTLWADPEVHALSEIADALNKLITGGVAMEIAMEQCGYSPQQIAVSVRKAEEAEQKALEREDQLSEKTHEQTMAQASAKATAAGSGTGAKPAATKKPAAKSAPAKASGTSSPAAKKAAPAAAKPKPTTK